MADDPFHHKMVDDKGEDGSQRRQWEQHEEKDGEHAKDKLNHAYHLQYS